MLCFNFYKILDIMEIHNEITIEYTLREAMLSRVK